MGQTLNIDEFRRFAPDIQNRIISNLLEESLIGTGKVLETVKKKRRIS